MRWPWQQRRSGGGRKRREFEQPKLVEAIQKLVDAGTWGDPMSPLRWTCKSTRTLADELSRVGFSVSANTVGRLLHECGYSLQANRKTIEGKKHPDRDAQFLHIGKRVRAFQRAGQPVISIDTKKKEPLGKLKNPGRTYRRKGDPEKVKTHDFPDKKLGKAVPYGVYDLTYNEAGVSVGISYDTAEFAVAAIRRWWKRLGEKKVPARDTAADHSRQWRQQQSTNTTLAVGNTAIRQRDGSDRGTLPLSTGYQQVEQNRASALLSHHTQLARRSTRDPGNRRQLDWINENKRRTGSTCLARRESLPEGEKCIEHSTVRSSHSA